MSLTVVGEWLIIFFTGDKLEDIREMEMVMRLMSLVSREQFGELMNHKYTRSNFKFSHFLPAHRPMTVPRFLPFCCADHFGVLDDI